MIDKMPMEQYNTLRLEVLMAEAEDENVGGALTAKSKGKCCSLM